MAYDPLDGQNPFYNPLSAQQMPVYYDIEGKGHKNYSYVYGPHQGKLCDCPECTKFNQDFANRGEQMELLDKIHRDAYDAFGNHFMTHGYLINNGTIDMNAAMGIMVNFTKKHIALYQGEMMKRIQAIQLEHTARLARVMDQQNQMAQVRARRDAERRLANEHDGRLFRVGEKEETD